MYCNECGARFKKTEEVCPKCGKSVAEMLEEENKAEEVAPVAEASIDTEISEEISADTNAENETEPEKNESEIDSLDFEGEEALEDFDKNDKNRRGNIGLIIAIISVVLVLLLGVYFVFSTKGFKFGKTNIEGIWDAGGYYFVFEGETAKQYVDDEVTQEYKVKNISKEEILLYYYDEKNKCTAEIGVKPVITEVDGEKQLELFTIYQNIKYDIDEKTESTLKMTKIDKLPDPVVLTFKDDMSKKLREDIYGKWKGTTPGADGKDIELVMNFDEDSVKYKTETIDSDYNVYYQADDDLVIRVYYEDYDYEYYMAYSPKIDGDKLTLTPKYYIQDGKTVEAGEDEKPTVLKRVK